MGQGFAYHRRCLGFRGCYPRLEKLCEFREFYRATFSGGTIGGEYVSVGFECGVQVGQRHGFAFVDAVDERLELRFIGMVTHIAGVDQRRL